MKLGIALIATMAALVLSLLIASAKSTYDTRRNQLLQVSVDIMLLDRVLAHYGAETKEARAMLQRSVAAAIEQFWPENGGRPATLDRRASPVEALYDAIQRLSPQSEVQRSLQNQASTIAPRFGAHACAALRRIGQLDPYSVPGGAGVLAVHHLRQLRALRSQKHYSNRNLLRLCNVGFRCDFFDPRARPLVRRAASGFQRAATRGPSPAGPVEKWK